MDACVVGALVGAQNRPASSRHVLLQVWSGLSEEAALATLTIPLTGKYFDQIKAGTKPEEYRLANEFWRKRLEGRSYDHIVLTRGYPRREDHSRRLEREWRGASLKTITHPHFGPEPVEVFAIDVRSTLKNEGE